MQFRYPNAEAAKEAGYTVDRTCYPWQAYKGPRFQPTEIFDVPTDLEARCLEALNAGAKYSNALDELQKAGMAGELVQSGKLDELFQDWHDKTHAILDPEPS